MIISFIESRPNAAVVDRTLCGPSAAGSTCPNAADVNHTICGSRAIGTFRTLCGPQAATANFRL